MQREAVLSDGFFDYMKEQETRKIKFVTKAGMIFAAFTLACSASKEKFQTNTPTMTPETSKAERTFTPIATLTKSPEATRTATTFVPRSTQAEAPIVLPTRVQPTIPPLSTETRTPLPTLTPRPIDTPRPTNIPKPTQTETPTPRPLSATRTPSPTPLPLEFCNSARFIEPTDGETVPQYVNVQVELANNNSWDEGCTLPSGSPAYVVVVDYYGHRFPWYLDCSWYPSDFRNNSFCVRFDVVVGTVPADVGHDFGLAAAINNIDLTKITVHRQ